MTVRKLGWVSEARFQPFLDACDGDTELAWKLYEWNASVASALFECFHHSEVLLRNSMMERLQHVHPLDYPWQRDQPSVVKAAERRRDADTKVASPDAVISELTLGFWATLLEKNAANEELWRHHLRHVFPGSPGTRASILRAVSDMRHVRNRCAHQDSLLDFDPRIELLKLLSLVEWIDPDARTWIEGIERVTRIADARPVQHTRNVVIIGASADEAVAMYEGASAYVCSADRSFATVEFMGFYRSKKIEPYFPRIDEIVVPTRWNRDEARRLKATGNERDARVARAMLFGLRRGLSAGGHYQVFLLSERKAADTRTVAAPIIHHKSGKGSAYVQNKRYLPLAALLAATDTSHLES